MFAGHDRILFQLLAARRLIAPDALQTAFARHQATGQPLAPLLLGLGLLDQSALLLAVAEHLGHACIRDLPATLPDDALALVERGLALTYGVAPIAFDDLAITLLTVDPFNPSLINDLTFALQREVRLAVADPAGVLRLIHQHYGEEEKSLDTVLGELRSSVATVDDSTLSETDLEQLAGQTPLVRFVNQVLAQAIRARASDIHFEPFEQEFNIRYRLDGTLYALPPPPKSLARPIISRLKVLANLNIAEHRLPQDGRIKLTLGGRAVDLRVSTLPTQFGESVVLRLLDQSSRPLELTQLGLPAPVHQGLEEIIHRPNGILLVTGPTGSGKTTTLYSCLQILNTIDAKLVTVEDPVEYELDGVMQVPVNLPAGLTFARALRTFLRQDPDIVMVGEIRDLETAQIAIQASLTGHLVLSTLHTNDAPGAITRLVDMGIEPFLLASTVEAVLAQRLVRRVCPSCQTAFAPTDALLRQLSLTPATLQGRPFFSGAGCPACHHTGYKGRLGLFEFLRLTDPLRELVGQGASLRQLQQKAVEQGMTTLRAAGIDAILAGQSTVEEVLKYTYD